MGTSTKNGVTSFTGATKILGKVPPPNSPGTFPFKVAPVTFASLGITRDASLLSKLSLVSAIAPNMGLATVELSTKKIASIRGNKLLFAGSISKLGIAIAAYVLRESVREFAKHSSSKTVNDLILEINTLWKPIVTKRFPREADFPRLTNIFTFIPPSLPGVDWQIEFITTPSLRPFLQNEKQPGAINCRPTLGFRERMLLMLQASNNEAASLCIDDIGFQYIQGALEATGFSVKNGLGIWVGKAFRFYAKPPSKAWGFPSIGGIQSATPDALVMLMVALDTKSLISISASTEIVTMLTGAGSFMQKALTDAGLPTVVKFAKDSSGAVDLLGDLDVCTKGIIRFGAAMLQVPSPKFDEVAIAMDGIF